MIKYSEKLLKLLHHINDIIPSNNVIKSLLIKDFDETIINVGDSEKSYKISNYFDIDKEDFTKISYIENNKLKKYNREIFNLKEDIHNSGYLDKIENNKEYSILKSSSDCFEYDFPNFIDENLLYINKSIYIRGKELNIHRTSSKPCKIIRKIFKEEYILKNIKDWEIEEFNNTYLNAINVINLKVVSGHDIKKWYNEREYSLESPKGTLLKSCMRYNTHSMDIYSDDEKIKMLIATDYKGKLIARALLWHGVEFDGVSKGNLMDRIYYTYEWLVDSFKDWATDNGYWYKSSQVRDCNNYINPKGMEWSGLVKFKPYNMIYEKYPYIDTFCFPDYKKGELCNIGESSISFQVQSGLPKLKWDRICCDYVVGGNWSNYHKTYISEFNSIIVEGEVYHKMEMCKDVYGGYITPSDILVECIFTNTYIAKRNVIYSPYHKAYIPKSKSIFRRISDKGDYSFVHEDYVIDMDIDMDNRNHFGVRKDIEYIFRIV